MKKSTKWVKVLGILYAIGGLLDLVRYFPFDNYVKLEFLLVGITTLVVGVGIYKLKKWALYGLIVLLAYGLVSSIYKFLFLKDYFVKPLGVGNYIVIGVGFLIGLLILFYLWSKRKLFK